MKKAILPFLLFCTTICVAQKKDRREGVYSAYLYSVEAPKGMTDVLVDTTKSIYEDQNIWIDWTYGFSQLGFELKNKSSQTLKVLWDDAAYIGIDNETGRVFHKGIKYTDRENPQTPSSVYKNSTLSDLVAPTSYSRYVSGQYGGWRSDPLIPVTQGVMSNKIDYIPAFIGQTIRVVLPIKIDENVIEYIFSFRTEFLEKKKK